MYKWYFYSPSHLRFTNNNTQTIIHVDKPRLRRFDFTDIIKKGLIKEADCRKIIIGEDYAHL